MENNEPLFDQIKTAAQNAEVKDFGAMESVWHRLEEKMDHTKDKKAILLWKKIAVAASLLLAGTLGYQFFGLDKNANQTKEIIVKTDTIQKSQPKNEVIATNETPNPAIKKEASSILLQQIEAPTRIALEETKTEGISALDSVVPIQQEYFNTASGISANQNSTSLKEDFMFKSLKAKEKTKEVELFMDNSNRVSTTKKEEPLVIVNNKVERKSVESINDDDVESLVILNDPLYIINGVTYTEQEVFGPKPTSPYTPLNQQEIESLSILQDEKAIEAYGEKGRKGVVIITTKNGKPASASKKAK